MAYEDPNTETMDEVKNRLHDDHYIEERAHARARSLPGTDPVRNSHRDAEYDHLSARQALGDFLPIGPGHPRFDEYNAAVNSSQSGKPRPLDSKLFSDPGGQCQHCYSGIMDHLAKQPQVDWRPNEAIPEDHYAMNEDAIMKTELKKLVKERLEKAISDLKPGVPTSTDPERRTKTYDYSHILDPEHIKAGYRIHVNDLSSDGSSYLHANLLHNNHNVGMSTANVNHTEPTKPVSIDVSEISDGHNNGPSFGNGINHRGKGLGVHLYESVLAHAKHMHGSQEVTGSDHSTAASRVHSSLSKKHGMGYVPTPNAYAANRPAGDYDGKNSSYSYPIN
jgi:hypothetical protein